MYNIYIYIYIYIYTYIHTYIHIYTYTHHYTHVTTSRKVRLRQMWRLMKAMAEMKPDTEKQ